MPHKNSKEKNEVQKCYTIKTFLKLLRKKKKQKLPFKKKNEEKTHANTKKKCHINNHAEMLCKISCKVAMQKKCCANRPRVKHHAKKRPM